MKTVIFISPDGCQTKQISKDEMKMLKELQTAVGGNIQLLPHPDGFDAQYVAYANEEGLLLKLPQNALAT